MNKQKRMFNNIIKLNNELEPAATYKRHEIMKTTIITKELNALEWNELRDYMQNCIEESMKVLDSHDAEHLMWYEDCEMEEYFTEWTEIWDGDNLIGEGLDTIAHQFVLNDDTRIDFESAFEGARDAAFNEVMESIGEEIESFYEDFEGFEELPFGEDDEEFEWNGEIEGYTRIGENNSQNTVFLEGKYEELYYAIYNSKQNGLNTNAFAAWIGATACASAESTEYCDWTSIYYKKNEQEPSNQLSQEDIKTLYEYEPYPEEDPRSTDLVKWIENGEYNSCFYTEDGKRLFKIKENPEDDSSWIVVYLDEEGRYWRY